MFLPQCGKTCELAGRSGKWNFRGNPGFGTSCFARSEQGKGACAQTGNTCANFDGLTKPITGSAPPCCCEGSGCRPTCAWQCHLPARERAACSEPTYDGFCGWSGSRCCRTPRLFHTPHKTCPFCITPPSRICPHQKQLNYITHWAGNQYLRM